MHNIYHAGVITPRCESKSGVKQLVHSVCPVYKRQFMFEEKLNCNGMLYFEHESEHETENEAAVLPTWDLNSNPIAVAERGMR